MLRCVPKVKFSKTGVTWQTCWPWLINRQSPNAWQAWAALIYCELFLGVGVIKWSVISSSKLSFCNLDGGVLLRCFPYEQLLLYANDSWQASLLMLVRWLKIISPVGQCLDCRESLWGENILAGEKGIKVRDRARLGIVLQGFKGCN